MSANIRYYYHFVTAAALFVFALLLVLALPAAPTHSAAGINEHINFQGRLLTAEGATVPDGFYNMQFKIYQDGDGQSAGNTTGAPAGSLKWTETYLNDNSQGITVRNGFMSVQLGSITPFGSSIDWNQDTLWLSMNIAGTGASCTPFASCSPDGEMLPMKRLSSTPYSLNSKLLGGVSSAGFVQLAQGLQTDSSTATPSININKTGTGDLIALQSGGADVFTLTNAGDIEFGANADHSISVNTADAETAGRDLTITAGTAGTSASALNGGNLVLQAGSGNASGDSGSVIVQSNTTNSTTAFQVLDTSGGNPVLNVDTASRYVGINTDAPQGALHVIGDSDILFQRSYNGANGPDIKIQKSRGSGTSPSAIQSGDYLGSYKFQGYTGSAFETGVEIEAVVSDYSGGNISADLSIFTSDNGTVSEKIRVASDGNFGIGDFSPASLLTVGDGDLFQVNSSGEIAAAAGITSSGTITFSSLGSCDIVVTNVSGDLSCGTFSGDGVQTVGAIDSQTKSSDGAVIDGTTIYLQSADASNPGLVSTSSQTFAGDKTFSGVLAVNSGSLTSTSNLTINANGAVDIQDSLTADDLTLDTGGLAITAGDVSFGSSGNRTIGIDASGTGVVGRVLTISAGDGGSGGGAVNGGNIVLSGGTGASGGANGLVVIDTPTITTATTQTCNSNCSINQTDIDSKGAVIIDATSGALEVTLPDPTNALAGRVVYVTSANSSEDFTLAVNGGGQGNEIAMRQNTTATMIWNGTDWTAAGASSSTTLQAAYNNTLTSAGGAEIVLSEPGGNADGLTIRNNDTTPIDGGILEVQSSIGTNLFSVNNRGTELAANGGSEDSSPWSTDWTTVANASVARTTTNGEYVTGQAGVEVITTAASGDGVRNNLSGNPAVSTTYQVSFTSLLDSGSFSSLEVLYSRNGGGDQETCSTYSTQTISSSDWTKITCTITTDGTTPTNPDLIIRQTDSTARTFWIDNLSFQRNDATTEPSNVQIGGGLDGGPITLFTLDRSSTPPVADGNEEYLGSMYYDTITGRIQCYETDGWGACGSPPNNIITLTPEYAGSVLNGTGVGTMTADFCADDTALAVNASLCDTGEAVNYYAWTSPQATSQTYSIHLTFQLPTTFDGFISNDTITLDARTTDTSDADVTYEVFRSTGSQITECGSDTTVTSSNNTWQTVAHGGDEADSCGFAGGDRVIFKLNMTARNNDTVYVSDINFTFTNE